MVGLLAQQQARLPFPLPPSSRAELDDLTDISNDGRVSWKASPAARSALEQAATDLTRVAEPSLAIIAVSRDPAVHFPWMTAERVPAEDRARAQECAALLGDLAEASVDAAAANPLIQRQVWKDAHHYLFQQFPQRTEDTIKRWLAGLARS